MSYAVSKLSCTITAALAVACGGPPQMAPAPLVEPVSQPEQQTAEIRSPAPSPSPTPTSDHFVKDMEATEETLPDAEALQSRALQQCQRAEELLEAGDVNGAILHVDEAYELLLKLPDDEELSQSRQDIRLLAAELIENAYRGDESEPDTPIASWDLGFPVVDNEHVQHEIKSFTSYEREHLLAGYKRSGRYRPMILKKLEEAGLPSQLSWLPLVESSFKVQALSRASALGLWQFISSTGLRYGLKRDGWVDQRLDPKKSTEAAIAYLTDLHRLFGDWPKALAAYNCGEGRIQRLQRSSKDEYLDFWDMYALLPDETRRYFPRLLAVLQIIENPEAYGITLPELDPPLPETETLTVERAIELAKLDEALGLDKGTIASLNPSLRHEATPKKRFELEVPAVLNVDLVAAVDSLPEYSPPKPKYVIHRVRSGETLSAIAERYHTSISAIMRLNHIRSKHRIWAGQTLRIPLRG